MNLKNLLFAAVIVLSANAAIAQQTVPVSKSHFVNISIPQVALLNLYAVDGTSITLNGTAPTVAGEPMTFEENIATNNKIWMNYSSIVSGDTQRKITVSLSEDLPTGLKLTVEATTPTSGAGTLGETLGEITLSSSVETDVVTEIGSTYTGIGANGSNLTYKLGYATDEATDYADLRFDDVPQLTITYTLTDI